jgi:hypothetical protein
MVCINLNTSETAVVGPRSLRRHQVVGLSGGCRLRRARSQVHSGAVSDTELTECRKKAMST